MMPVRRRRAKSEVNLPRLASDLPGTFDTVPESASRAAPQGSQEDQPAPGKVIDRGMIPQRYGPRLAGQVHVAFKAESFDSLDPV